MISLEKSIFDDRGHRIRIVQNSSRFIPHTAFCNFIFRNCGKYCRVLFDQLPFHCLMETAAEQVMDLFDRSGSHISLCVSPFFIRTSCFQLKAKTKTPSGIRKRSQIPEGVFVFCPTASVKMSHEIRPLTHPTL